MNDTLLMRGVERVRDLSREPQRLIVGQPVPNSIRECFSLDQLEDQATHARASGRLNRLEVFEPVNRRDVRMIQRRERTRFALEARQPLRVVGKRVREYLNRHGAAELRIARAIDLAHCAGADQGFDLIDAELTAGQIGLRHGSHGILPPDPGVIPNKRYRRLPRRRVAPAAIRR